MPPVVEQLELGPTDLPGASWETLLESIRSLVEVTHPRRWSTPATVERRRSEPSSLATRFSASCAWSGRHDL
jgi:hypothetical protein